MRITGWLLIFLSLPALSFTQRQAQITDIDFGQTMGDEILVLLSDGHVAKVNPSSEHLLKLMQDKTFNTAWFNFTLDKNRYIKKISPLAPVMSSQVSPLAKNLDETYTLTTIENTKTAQKYFRQAKHPAKEETQCFNRAMVWSYEWWKDHSLKSGKLLIFFTRNYIRRYDFEWWFHITPYVHVMDNGVVVERAMDVKYTRGPIEFRRWSNIFMKNNADCPVITKYSDYADNPYHGECFLQRTHMYTYQPADLQMYEAWGYLKTAFNMDEVKGAYLEAFTARPREEEENEDEGNDGI